MLKRILTNSISNTKISFNNIKNLRLISNNNGLFRNDQLTTITTPTSSSYLLKNNSNNNILNKRLYSSDNDKRRFAIPVESKEEAKRLYFSYVLMLLATSGLYFYLYTEYKEYVKRKELAETLSGMTEEEIANMIKVGLITEKIKELAEEENKKQQQQQSNKSN